MKKSRPKSTKRKKWGRSQRGCLVIFIIIGVISSVAVITQLQPSHRHSFFSPAPSREPDSSRPDTAGQTLRFQPSNREDFMALLEIGQKIETLIQQAKYPGTKVFTPGTAEPDGYSILVMSGESLYSPAPPGSKAKLARDAWLISTVTAAGKVTRDSSLPFKDLIVTDSEAFKDLKGFTLPISVARDLQRLVAEGQIDLPETGSRINSAITACLIEKKQMARTAHPTLVPLTGSK